MKVFRQPKSGSSSVPSFTPVRKGVLQRKCACGGTPGPSGECAECRKKRLQRQRTPHAGATPAPPLVEEVLRAPGRPLDAATRSFMEQRFGHDVRRVRVHTGGRAAASAAAVGARAYTVGRDVVFGTGQYAPGAAAGRRLLAHELTHVVQQRQGDQSFRRKLAVSRPGDAAEREAEAVANRIDDSSGAPAIRARPSAATIHFQRDQDPGQPAPPPSQPAPTHTCGPNVTTQVENAVSLTKSTFAGWSTADKGSACQALISLRTGAYAWDIVDLHNNAWILGYRPACATQGATPPCGSTVQVGSECSYAGSPNYVIYGVMMKLCHAHYTAAGSTSDAADFTRAEMLDWINIYKGTGWLGLSTPSANFVPSKNWAGAGYDGWPSTTTPAGDRNTCSPTCPTAYSGSAFRVTWVPKGTF